MILIAYDGSSETQSAIEHAGELLSGRTDDGADGVGAVHGGEARTGAGLGAAPATVNFEEIDKASRERPRSCLARAFSSA